MINNNDTVIEGVLKETSSDGYVRFVAASPPDFRASYSGSGLPFSNKIQAFDNTPNIGTVKLGADGSYTINLMMPNSYMSLDKKIPPSVFLFYRNTNGEDRMEIVPIDGGTVPYRSITYQQKRKDAQQNFYASQFYIPVRGQEQILREAGYPIYNYEPVNHWGLKPPL